MSENDIGYTVSAESPASFDRGASSDLTISYPENMNIIFFGTNGKQVLWITPDGKIHVDPDAPADEAAKAVCEQLSRLSVR